MPWFSKAILKKSEALEKVLDYSPLKFDLGTPSQALNYLDAKKNGADFRMSDVVRAQTGVEKMEQQSYEERIENLALEKLKAIQEGAYQEGYKLGLDEGHKKAFEDHSEAIKANLQEMSTVLASIKNMKKEICSFNESHMVQLLFHMAARLTHDHLKVENQPIVDIIKQAVELAQSEESVTVHVSEKQIAFLETLQAQKKVELDFLDKVKFISNSNITPGGCIVETNYGEVDARVEQRIEKLWETLKENLPRVKSQLAG
jgi:flagellar assembly protein FliH